MESGNTRNARGLHVLRELDMEKLFLSPHSLPTTIGEILTLSDCAALGLV